MLSRSAAVYPELIASTLPCLTAVLWFAECSDAQRDDVAAEVPTHRSESAMAGDAEASDILVGQMQHRMCWW